MTTPNDLKAEFTELFEKQKSIEKSSKFQTFKRKHKQTKLESKHDLNTLSEIFQDPDLLARVSEDAFLLMKAKERESRVRNQFELVTTKKPQAKDVERIRVVANDDIARIAAMEEDVKKGDKYISPIGPKKRRYLAQQGSGSGFGSFMNIDTESIIMRLVREVQEGAGDMGNNETQDLVERSAYEDYLLDDENQLSVGALEKGPIEAIASESTGLETEKQIEKNHESQATLITDPLNFSALVLPDKSSSDLATVPSESAEEEHPLEKSFKETALLVKKSPLKTVGSRYLYTLLPRQCDPNAYKYVKEDYTPQNISNEDERNSVKDTLITISVFNPSNPNNKFQEIEILGSQSLSDFRDSVYCLSDFMSNGDKKGKLPNGEIVNTYVKKVSPSFIYIDHIFYVDTRLSDITDKFYDDAIEAWLTKKGVSLAVFRYQKKCMQDVLLEDISFSLQKPYVFLHQDKCEHMIIIQDLRLISPVEHKSRNDFPRTTRNLKYDRFKCSMCSVFPATKVTEEFITSGFSPCYFCDKCFASFPKGSDPIIVKEYSGTAGGDVKRHRY